MEAFQQKMLEVESSLKSFIERTDEKLDTLSHRMDSCESFIKEYKTNLANVKKATQNQKVNSLQKINIEINNLVSNVSGSG